MRILITGGFGFQGKHLARRLLASGHQVVLLVSPRLTEEEISKTDLFGLVEIIQGDILNTGIVDQLIEKVDVVYHLAGKVNPRESIIDPRTYFRINVDGTLVVLEAVRKNNKRLLYVSSCAVYGDGSYLESGESFNEESPLLPIDPYGASKVAADRLCYAYYRSYGLDITIIRPFTSYGPGQPAGVYGGLIPAVTHRAIQGEPLIVYGDGSAIRDFIYIDDLIDAYELLLISPGTTGQVFNVASGRETKVVDVVEYIAKRFGASIEYKHANQAEVKRYAANIEKITNLGFSPKTKLEEGISRYLETLDRDEKKK